MRKASWFAATAIGVLGLVACSGDDSPTAAGGGTINPAAVLTLHGDSAGTGVTLESAPANAQYKPSYPVANVRQMVVTLLASGEADKLSLGPVGLGILRVQPGEHVELRLL